MKKTISGCSLLNTVVVPRRFAIDGTNVSAKKGQERIVCFLTFACEAEGGFWEDLLPSTPLLEGRERPSVEIVFVIRRAYK